MRLTDTTGLDPNYQEILVLFNARPGETTFSDPALTANYVLHSIQQNSADAVAQQASYTAGNFNIPGRTTAVFVLARTEPLATTVPAAEPTTVPITTPASQNNSNSLTIAGIITALLALIGAGLYLKRHSAR